MPPLGSHQSAKFTKLLLIGDSGAGKTGALASLAAAGYALRVIDMDNGLDVLKNLLGDAKSRYGSEALGRVHFRTITDPMRSVNGKLIPRSAKAWETALKMIEKWTWTDPETGEIEDLGPACEWGERAVLVLDSLTMLSTAAMNFVLSMNARLGGTPQLQDWYVGQQLVEALLQELYDESMRCNVIVMSHVAFLGPEGQERGYPNTLGKALPPKVGRYFNSTLMVQSSGSGENVKRRIWTATRGAVELKNTAPGRVKGEYPLETGLADYFRDVRGEAPG